ncbi:hypothetical protein TW616 [Tropheryma whipplei TW08/27]|nr:hypothetical protein TW616 [Tropheryma whipplei TW08/27]
MPHSYVQGHIQITAQYPVNRAKNNTVLPNNNGYTREVVTQTSHTNQSRGMSQSAVNLIITALGKSSSTTQTWIVLTVGAGKCIDRQSQLQLQSNR